MAIAQDILLDPDGDLLFRDGDIVIGASDEQHIEDTIYANPGDWKQFPPDGVGVNNYLGSSGMKQQLAREITIQLQSDGYTVNNPRVSITEDNLTVQPNAIRQ